MTLGADELIRVRAGDYLGFTSPGYLTGGRYAVGFKIDFANGVSYVNLDSMVSEGSSILSSSLSSPMLQQFKIQASVYTGRYKMLVLLFSRQVKLLSLHI